GRCTGAGRQERAAGNGTNESEANMMMRVETYVSSEAESREVAEQARQAEWEGKGFLRDLFLGKLRFEFVHPFPLVREERAEFRKLFDEMKRFLIDQVDPAVIDQTGEYPPHVIEGLSNLGAFGMKIPKEYGGLGLTVAEYCAVMEMIGSYDNNVPAVLYVHQSVGDPHALKHIGPA